MPKSEGDGSRGGRNAGSATEQDAPADTLKYIIALSGGLGDLARRERLDMVAYFLDLARLEAQQLEQKSKL